MENKIGCVSHDCDKCKTQAVELKAAKADCNALAGNNAHLFKLANDTIAERDALQAKLSTLESQEPVAWMRKDGDLITAQEKRPDYAYTLYYDTPLYAAPVAQPAEKRPINCGTNCCSCIECPYEDKP